MTMGYGVGVSPSGDKGFYVISNVTDEALKFFTVTLPGGVETWTEISGGAGGTGTAETPSGAINGANAVFTLAHTPIAGSLMVFLNGLKQTAGAGNDFVLAGTTITFESGMIPQSGDSVTVTYSF